MPVAIAKMFGFEDDVLGRKADAGKQVVGALADPRSCASRCCLALLVESHHDHRRAVLPAQPRLAQELGFAFLHRDRIDDPLPWMHLRPPR